MQIELDTLKDTLIQLKDEAINLLDRIPKQKVKDLLIERIRTLETILIWIAQSESKGVLDMEALKIGLGKTVKLSDIVKPTRSKLDAAIMEEASFLKEMGDARPIDPKAVNIQYFTNRVYQLAREGKIHPDAKPIRAGDALYIALKPSVKRKQKANA